MRGGGVAERELSGGHVGGNDGGGGTGVAERELSGLLLGARAGDVSSCGGNGAAEIADFGGCGHGRVGLLGLSIHHLLREKQTLFSEGNKNK